MFIEHPSNNRMVSTIHLVLFVTSQFVVSILEPCRGRLEYKHRLIHYCARTSFTLL